VYVPLPDVKGRMDILKVHSRKVKLGPNVDLLRWPARRPVSAARSRRHHQRSGAGRDAGGQGIHRDGRPRRSARQGPLGPGAQEPRDRRKEKIATAYHEAGHAVVQYLTKDADPIHKVTIIPRGNFGGATMSLPEKDRNNVSKKWCIATMKTCFGGRIAERCSAAT
jgi:cell division protease FtsH